MWSTPSSPLLPDPLYPQVRVLTIGQRDQFEKYSYLIGLCAKRKTSQETTTQNMLM